MGRGDLTPQRVTYLRINDAGRIDTTVVLGSLQHDLVLSTLDDEVLEAVAALHQAVLKKARLELVEHLETDLSPSTRSALSR